MSKLFSSSEKIGDIAARFSKAMEVFKDYNIDFCCGGDKPLNNVLKEQNINEEELLAKLEEAYNKILGMKVNETDWNSIPLTELIDHIINTHHAFLVKNLPRLSSLTAKILRVHGVGHEELSKVHRLFHNLKLELEQHLIKEEEIVFPLIKEFEQAPSAETLKAAERVIEELEAEHEGAGDILKELRQITSNYTLPEDGCNTYVLTYNLLEELEGDLFQHIHLENNILFPRLLKGTKGQVHCPS
jgi:regulator of cell morphogenesis and NO signaling